MALDTEKLRTVEDLFDPGHVDFNLPRAALYEEALIKKEARITGNGALLVYTGKHTGRAAKDKYVVKDSETEDKVNWGEINQPIDEERYFSIREKFFDYIEKLQKINNKKLYVQDCIAGADRGNSINVRVVTELAWHNLFISNMLESINSESAKLAEKKGLLDRKSYEPEYRIIDIPSFRADPEIDGLRSGTFILVNFKLKEVLIAGTEYGGEIKKSAFSILNYLLPQKEIMPMHCSANADKEFKDVAIFFGLSGTGKTTLSAEAERVLIGDDEHGWSDAGVFNFESGCYAKSIGLTLETEPEIYNASRRFGATVENVRVKEDRTLDYFDTTLTENGRISYPLSFIPNALVYNSKGEGSDRFIPEQPKNVIMLCCDAFGVLPAVAKLSPEKAKEYFLLGYTAKVAGTEQGIKEPTATFSPCFGAPFMPLMPEVYGDLLLKKVKENNVACWLVNTGWAGGSYGSGSRMSIKLTRSIISKIHSGELVNEATVKHGIFDLEVPVSIKMPEASWSSKDEYQEKALKLKAMFDEQREKIYSAA
ncbi:MAG: phosphoenolpyruvate carboxykinase (ATP) [Candidatus Caenarcaniphilales bacterium]|nr:phosphoenolpyruvate carboxykinase (ATP) [Candidatus Caenarcaniphilales bacterium]